MSANTQNASKVTAGLWRFGPYQIANHPRVFPRSWVVSEAGHWRADHRTLTAAVAWCARRSAAVTFVCWWCADGSLMRFRGAFGDPSFRRFACEQCGMDSPEEHCQARSMKLVTS